MDSAKVSIEMEIFSVTDDILLVLFKGTFQHLRDINRKKYRRGSKSKWDGKRKGGILEGARIKL